MALTLKAPSNLLRENHLGEYSCRVTGVISSSAAVALENSLSPREQKTNSIHSAGSSSEDLQDESPKLPPSSPLNLALPNKRHVESKCHLDVPLDLSVQKTKISSVVAGNNDVTPLDLTVNKTQNRGNWIKSRATTPQAVASPQKSKTPPTYVCDNLFDLKLKIKRSKSHTISNEVLSKVDARNNKIDVKRIETSTDKSFVSTRSNSCDVIFSNSVNNPAKKILDDDVIIVAHQAPPPIATTKEDFRKCFMPPLGSRKRPSPPMTTDEPKLKKSSVNEISRTNFGNIDQKTVEYLNQHHANKFPPNMTDNLQGPTPFVPNILKKGKTLRQLETTYSNPTQSKTKTNVNFANIPMPVRSLAPITPKPFATQLTTYSMTNHRPQTTSLVHPVRHSHQQLPLMNNVPRIDKRNAKLNGCVRSPPGGLSIVSTPLNINKPLMSNHAMTLDYMARQMTNIRPNNVGNSRPFNVGNNTIGYGESKKYRPRPSQMTIDINKALMAARAVPKVSPKPQIDWNMNLPKAARVNHHPHPLSPANLIQSKGRLPNPSDPQYIVKQRPAQSIDEPRRICVKCKREAYYLCSGCKNMWYCSKHCQLNHWKTHSASCNAE